MIVYHTVYENGVQYVSCVSATVPLSAFYKHACRKWKPAIVWPLYHYDVWKVKGIMQAIHTSYGTLSCRSEVRLFFLSLPPTLRPRFLVTGRSSYPFGSLFYIGVG